MRVTDAAAQIAAVRQWIGITTRPCFVGDADPLLVRVPDLHMYAKPWLLHRVRPARGSACDCLRSSYPTGCPPPLLAGLSILRGCVRFQMLQTGS